MSCPAEGATCDRNGVCPCQNAELIKSILEPRAEAVKTLQEVMLWRRPIAMGVLIFVVELALIIYGKMNLTFLASVFFLFTVYLIGKLLYPKVAPLVKKFLLNGEVPQGTPEESNHVRSIDDLTKNIMCCLKPMACARGFYLKYAKDQTVVGQLIHLAIVFAAFIIVANVNVFCVFSILVNVLLLAPGIWTHPKVRELLGKVEKKAEKVEKKVEEAAEKVEEKAEEVAEKAEEKVEEAAEKVEEKAEEVKEAVEDKVEAVEEKIEEAAEKVEEKAE